MLSPGATRTPAPGSQCLVEDSSCMTHLVVPLQTLPVGLPLLSTALIELADPGSSRGGSGEMLSGCQSSSSMQRFHFCDCQLPIVLKPLLRR